MIIQNLEYSETVTEVNDLEGGRSRVRVAFDTLALGFRNSTNDSYFEALAVSSPGNNVAGSRGWISLSAN